MELIIIRRSRLNFIKDNINILPPRYEKCDICETLTYIEELKEGICLSCIKEWNYPLDIMS